MLTKILVVDDEEDLKVLIKQRFRQEIRQNEYDFIFAENGRQALEQLLEHTDVDLVLSDINMPEMDGLTLLSKLNEQSSSAQISDGICLWRYGKHPYCHEPGGL